MIGGDNISSAKLKANQEWLIWARKTSYYDIKEIAQKMDVDEDTIVQWEDTGNIKYKDLVKLANYYHRPPMIFFNVNKPEYDEPIPDLRTYKSKRKYGKSPEFSFEIRNAVVRRKKLLRLEEESDEYKIPQFAFKDVATEDATKIADIINDRIKMNLFRNSKKLDYWINKIENLGVLVFQFYGINPKEIRGYALYYDKLPIIGINTREYPNGKKFTLFHELAHLIIKKEGFSNFDSYFLKDNEKLCNEIAAETLVPFKELEIKFKDLTYTNDLDYTIKLLSKYFKVSNEVITRRLLDLNYASKNDYQSRKEKWDSYIAKKERSGESKKRKSKDEVILKNKPDPQLEYIRKATMSLKRNGLYYTKSILTAYDEGIKSIDDVTEDLRVPIEVVREIRKKINVGGPRIDEF